MRKWELIAIITALVTVIGTPLAAFGYQTYRESRQGPEAASIRAPSSFMPTGDVAAGRQVFLGNCAACHGEDARGNVGPDLYGVAAFGPTFLYAFVSNPETVNNQATMPRVPLSRQAIADVVTYLLRISGVGFRIADLDSATQSESRYPKSEMGGHLFQSKGCVACHGPEAQGTDLAPSLVGKIAEAIRQQVREPKEKMPPFSTTHLSDSELEAIIQYIESLSKAGPADE
ncbi:MAG: c-type cytochrome [Anaerolineae bacterium]